MESTEGIPEVIITSMKGLCEKSHDRKLSAAKEIAEAVMQQFRVGDVVMVKKVLMKLKSDFLKSPTTTNRIGGLVAYGSIALELDKDIADFIPDFIDALLPCVGDSDAKVRYYSSEAIYNLVKSIREKVVNYLERFFYILSFLFSDADTDVKKGAYLLDKLLKDIIPNVTEINLEHIVNLLIQSLSHNNHYVLHLTVSWISMLDNIPGLNMMAYFPQLMNGLFLLLGNEQQEIASEAENILTSFLSEITSSKLDPLVINTMLNTLLKLVRHQDYHICKTSILWIHQFILLDDVWDIPYSSILRALLSCMVNDHSKVTEELEECCTKLMQSLRKKAAKIEPNSLMEAACEILTSKQCTKCLVCLEMVDVLLEARPEEVIANEALRTQLLNTLKDENNEVVERDLKVLVKYVESSKDLPSLIKQIVEMLEQDREFMEKRSNLILRSLCKYIRTEHVFPHLASIIKKSKDKQFAGLFIQMLNTILFTADETSDLRRSLKSCFAFNQDNKEGRALFDQLFSAWCVNPFAALALCWFSEEYVVAYHITQSLATQEISLEMLLQADKLVQLLESHVFVHVRLQLLNTGSPQLAPLLQSLYGLMMLLPQTSSYQKLQNRLNGVLPLHVIIMNNTDELKMEEKEQQRIAVFNQANYRRDEI